MVLLNKIILKGGIVIMGIISILSYALVLIQLVTYVLVILACIKYLRKKTTNE